MNLWTAQVCPSKASRPPYSLASPLFPYSVSAGLNTHTHTRTRSRTRTCTNTHATLSSHWKHSPRCIVCLHIEETCSANDDEDELKCALVDFMFPLPILWINAAAFLFSSQLASIHNILLCRENMKQNVCFLNIYENTKCPFSIHYSNSVMVSHYLVFQNILWVFIWQHNTQTIKSINETEIID